MTAAAQPLATPETPSKGAASLVETGRFLALDGLRGVAAFAVILDHVASVTLRSWFPGRYLAVDFFFVLSGFVLAHAYGRRLGQNGMAQAGASTPSLTPLGFLKVRMIRLYPLYLLALAIALIPQLVGHLRGWDTDPMWQLIAVAGVALLFIPMPPVFGWTNDHLYPLNGPAWSLFFELVANVIYAAIARYLSWRVFAVMLPVLAAAVAFTVMRHTETLGPGWLWHHFDAGLARVLFDFFAGVAIYRLRQSVRIPAIPAWLGVLALLAIFAVPASGLWRQGFDALAAIVLMPVLVALVSGATVNGVVAKLCSGLGTLSYGVYVLHVPILSLTALAVAVLHVELPYGFMVVLLVASLAAITAALAHRVYDAPVRRWLMATFPVRARRAKPHLSPGEAG